MKTKESTARTIISQYTNGHILRKTTRSRHANNAVANAVMHMQLDHYKALVCEVWDEGTGELHAVIKRNVKGTITVLFHRHPVDESGRKTPCIL
jgi:hypothetical protein